MDKPAKKGFLKWHIVPWLNIPDAYGRCDSLYRYFVECLMFPGVPAWSEL
jgi:hypothetical protein